MFKYFVSGCEVSAILPNLKSTTPSMTKTPNYQLSKPLNFNPLDEVMVISSKKPILHLLKPMNFNPLDEGNVHYCNHQNSKK